LAVAPVKVAVGVRLSNVNIVPVCRGDNVFADIHIKVCCLPGRTPASFFVDINTSAEDARSQITRATCAPLGVTQHHHFGAEPRYTKMVFRLETKFIAILRPKIFSTVAGTLHRLKGAFA